jgi:flagellin-specific chaperone FliS
MNKLNLDVIYLIFEFLDFLSKITFRGTTKYMYKLEIHDFYNIEKKYLKLLNDEILLNYPYIKYLNASGNRNITNVNHMGKSLIELNASGTFCGINNKGIKNLNLLKLYAYYNPKIYNVNHMENIIELDASYNCGISDEGIKNLKNLQKLCATDNFKIKNINHMTQSLIELDASYDCGISDEGITKLNLQILYSHCNEKIKNVNHMNKLIKFNKSECCDWCTKL